MFKRVLVTTFLGFIAGLICVWGALGRGFGFWILLSALANRVLIGFAIGISSLKLPWFLHGILIGAIFGLPLSLAAVPNGGFWILEIASIVYGFLIELITTKVLKIR